MMQEYGTVTAQIVTSAAQIPIPGATLTITRELPDGRQELLAVRMTNYDGFTEPFDVPTPPASDSQTRQTAETPYALVDLRGEHAGYDRVFIHNAQVFPGIQTLQQIVLIPTPTLPDSYAQTRLLYTQNRRFELGDTGEADDGFIDPYADGGSAQTDGASDAVAGAVPLGFEDPYAE